MSELRDIKPSISQSRNGPLTISEEWMPGTHSPLRYLHSVESLDARQILRTHAADFGSKRVLTAKLGLEHRTPFPRGRLAPSTLDERHLIDETCSPALGKITADQNLPIQTPITATSRNSIDALHHRDWETKPPWVGLLEDIHLHYIIKNDLENFDTYQNAPIDYVCLQEWNLRDVNDLLENTFWPGIDVTSALEETPQKYTVVAMYKRLVIGAAFISPPPDEAYITYIAVKSGWEFSKVAQTMLYLLISNSPDRDIMLHVSADNPAMILYNKFGFKGEEFIAGFYDDYLDPKSKACRNALRLRLRQT